jgi:uncharacterized 2Fe-2S/4Fe-4S cluster protein (DUF4445 family)
MNQPAADTVTGTFLPEDRAVAAPTGTTILDAATAAGIHLETICSGRGTCGKCRVLVKGYEAPAPTPVDSRRLSPAQLQAGWRMACEHPFSADGVYTHPLVETQLRTVQSAGIGEIQLRPNVQQHVVTPAAPDLEHPVFDWPRVKEELASLAGGVDASLAALRRLSGVIREAGNGPITATLVGSRAIDFEPGDTTAAPALGLAFDIGTTTVVGALMDLESGAELAVAAELNGQAVHGADVISRTTFAAQGEDDLETLRMAVLETINGIIDRLLRAARVERRRVHEATFVGNTVMLHLLTGIDPAGIGSSPFVGVTTESLTTTAAALEINLEADAGVFLFPAIAGYVGADLVGVVVSTRLAQREGNVLVIDVGTNGEIALVASGRILCTSAAAGPAFEGAEISRGMRAVAGAVERITLGEAGPELGVIGDIPPTGICGSGLVDAVAELVRTGIVSPTGRLLPPDDLPGDVPKALRRRVHFDDDGGRFLLADDDPDAADALPLIATDIRQLQLAKAAIRVGVDVLLERAGIGPDDLDEILLAGAFGAYLDAAAVLNIGMVPPIPAERIRPVGNAAGLGARLGLLSLNHRVEAELLVGEVEYLELSAVADFQWLFADAMAFPEPA